MKSQRHHPLKAYDQPKPGLNESAIDPQQDQNRTSPLHLRTNQRQVGEFHVALACHAIAQDVHHPSTRYPLILR